MWIVHGFLMMWNLKIVFCSKHVPKLNKMINMFLVKVNVNIQFWVSFFKCLSIACWCWMASYYYYLGQILLPLMDEPSIKCVIKIFFCFSFEINENWCVLKLHQVSSNLNQKQKNRIVLMTQIMDNMFVKGGEFSLRTWTNRHLFW